MIIGHYFNYSTIRWNSLQCCEVQRNLGPEGSVCLVNSEVHSLRFCNGDSACGSQRAEGQFLFVLHWGRKGPGLTRFGCRFLWECYWQWLQSLYNIERSRNLIFIQSIKFVDYLEADVFTIVHVCLISLQKWCLSVCFYSFNPIWHFKYGCSFKNMKM